MKTVLAALNAAYPHTALGVRAVAACAREKAGRPSVVIWERTINHRYRQLLQELAALAGDVVVFSLYIWNIELMRRLAADLRQINTDTVLVAAGPEASCHSESFLAENPAFDLVIAGEGERALAELLPQLAAFPGPGRRGQLRALYPAAVVRGAACDNLDTLPFPYEGEDLAALCGRILYYESMRGCPFCCAYCLSSIDRRAVRLRSLDRVFADLRRFVEAGVRQVKFVDRTFNCDAARARAIWRWLRDNDNGVTGFHFELAGELLDDASCELLATLRPGLVQFEVGVQSTCAETLRAISRPAGIPQLFERVRRVQLPGNIHLHLDLIAGLPHEDYARFARSFNDVYALAPAQLQLGFLKVLKGSAIERDARKYGIRCQSEAPYEVLRTSWLAFPELARLHGVADMVELYYNSGRFTHLLADACREAADPFAFYEALADYFQRNGHRDSPPSKTAYYEILGGFLREMGILLTGRRQWLCRYDMALHEKPRRQPDWVSVDGAAPHRQRILNFLRANGHLERYLPAYAQEHPARILKIAHAEVFPFHPGSGAPGETAVFFDYARRDPRGWAATTVLPLPQALEMREGI